MFEYVYMDFKRMKKKKTKLKTRKRIVVSNYDKLKKIFKMSVLIYLSFQDDSSKMSESLNIYFSISSKNHQTY